MPTYDNEHWEQLISTIIDRIGVEQFLEGTIDLAIELAGARDDHSGDREFGRWLEGRFGDNHLPHQERAILIKWGRDVAQTRSMLENTESRSIQVIDRSFTRSSKGPAEPASTTAKREEAKDSIRVHKSLYGSYPTVIQAGKETGLSRIVIEPALAAVKAEDRVAPSEIRFTKAQEHHVEARVKIEVKAAIEQLHKSFEEEVEKRNKADIDKLFPKLEEMQARAQTTEKLYREQIEKHAIFTEAEYRDILLCTHEGNPSAETRERAFIAFNAKKLQLTGKR